MRLQTQHQHPSARPQHESLLVDHSDEEEEEEEEEDGLFYETMATTTTTMQEQTPLLALEVSASPPPLVAERQDDDSEDKDPLLEVIDRIEDEVDHTYEELVPLEVKLALEDKVFGWSHLSSDILGHVVFTVGAYTLSFLFLTHLLPSSYMPLAVFRLVRFLLSFWAGLSAFRMVRRRRRVWLRSAYGSKEYQKDAQWRREHVKEIDRTTMLGRIRRRRALMVERKHQRKLRKAVERFKSSQQKKESMMAPTRISLLSKSDSRLEKGQDDKVDDDSAPPRRRRAGSFHALSTQQTKSIGHDQILLERGPIRKIPYSHGSFFGAAPFMLANPHWIDVLRLLMPDVYIEISLRVVHAPAPKLIHWAENNPVVAAYGTAHELENTNVIPNLEWDVFLDPHLVKRVEVVLQEQEKFLRSCVPDAYRDLHGKQLRDEILANAEKLGLTASQRSILVYYETELRQRTELLVDNMLIAHGNLTQLVLEQTGYLKKYNFSRVKRTRRTLGGGMFARQWLAVFAESLKLGKCLDGSSVTRRTRERSPSRKGDVQLYSSSSLLSRTESSSDEDSDEAGDGVFRCKCLQCTRGGGGGADLDCSTLQRQSSDLVRRNQQQTASLLHAASFGGSSTTPTTSPPTSPMSRSAATSPLRQRAGSADVVSNSQCLSTSIAESISIIKFITGCQDPLGLVFDIKSRFTSKQVWGLIVDFLRDAGARVEGVASFAVEDIRGISSHTTKAVKELFFFHSAGDMQQACHDGRLKQGDTVLFNAGSLLWDSRTSHAETTSSLRCFYAPFDADQVKRNYHIQPFAQYEQESRLFSTIKDYKDKFGLSIGLYLQEFAIDETALNMIVQHVNGHFDVYDLGLSWGGVNGVTVRGIQPGRFTVTDGFWNQRYASADWDYNQFPEDVMAR